jgi:hypothetical protein
VWSGLDGVKVLRRKSWKYKNILEKYLDKCKIYSMEEITGFLLGAGASYELGLPLVDELTIEFKRALFRTKEMRYYAVPLEIA